jgi:polysaccharide biosynthesis protein PslG
MRLRVDRRRWILATFRQVHGRYRLALLAALALLMTAGLAGSAEAAKRKVPFGFFGVVMPPEMYVSNTGVSDAALDQQMALMASSGVETVRVTYDWGYNLEPAPGVYRLAALDRMVAAAARHRIQTLVNVTSTPSWLSGRPNDPEHWRYPPTSTAPFAELMRRLVQRYGPGGSLWIENPTLPRVPVRQWQVWNEQTAPWHWRKRPWAPGYTQLLKASYLAIKGLDRGAKVIAGSLVASSAKYPPWNGMRDLYRAGAKRWFDQVAVHPFTNNKRSVGLTTTQLLEIVRRVRAQMKRHRDGRKQLLVTEMTWPASVGRVPRQAQFGIETTPAGQAARLRAAYSRLAAARRKLRIGQVYWYTWATQYDRQGSLSVMTFRYAGLTRWRGGTFTPLPILRTYARTAARYEGCRKTADARRCR